MSFFTDAAPVRVHRRRMVVRNGSYQLSPDVGELGESRIQKMQQPGGILHGEYLHLEANWNVGGIAHLFKELGDAIGNRELAKQVVLELIDAKEVKTAKPAAPPELAQVQLAIEAIASLTHRKKQTYLEGANVLRLDATAIRPRPVRPNRPWFEQSRPPKATLKIELLPSGFVITTGGDHPLGERRLTLPKPFAAELSTTLKNAAPQFREARPVGEQDLLTFAAQIENAR